MKFIQLNPNEFDAFAQKNLSHYTQSKSHFLNRKKYKGIVISLVLKIIKMRL